MLDSGLLSIANESLSYTFKAGIEDFLPRVEGYKGGPHDSAA